MGSMRSFPYYLVLFVPLSVVHGYHLGGGFTFLTLWSIFGVIPFLDLFIGTSTRNPSPEQARRIKDALRFKIITWFCAPVQVGLVIWGAFVIAGGGLSALEMVGFTLSMGTSSGVMGINVSHELQHRVNHKFEPLLSRFMLWSVAYMDWAVEHVAGLHRHVATLDDPATARLHLFCFCPQRFSADSPAPGGSRKTGYSARA